MAEASSERWHAVVVVETPVVIAPESGRGRLMDLALDPDLHADSQAAAQEEVLSRSGEGLLRLGDTVTFRARHFGVPWRMTARISELDRPTRFVDEQVRGPFAAFRHTHRFEAHGPQTMMIDEFAFRLPAMAAGRLIARTAAVPYLRRLLTDRARFLAQLAEASDIDDGL